MHCPSCNNQKLKLECSRLRFDDTCLGVDADYFSHEDGCVFLAPQNMSDRPRDIGGRERSSCHLVKQWLKTMIIMAIDLSDLDRRASYSFRRFKTAKAGAQYYDPKVQLLHAN